MNFTEIKHLQIGMAFVNVNIDGWIDNLRFYVLFNSISVISGQWADDNERLCTMEPCLVTVEKIFPRVGLEPLEL